ncbi:hypothetical protein LZK76_02980 [Rhizobium leguminosarum]|nr:hypothetical protein LZK76_02980 [Rhizobium leguminosarum]
MLPKISLKALVATTGMALLALGVQQASAGNVATFDNGDRMLVPFSWKIEHAQGTIVEFIIGNLNTTQGRELLGAAAMAFE